MKKLFLVIFNDKVGKREVVTRWANECDLITTWRADMPHCVYVVSEHSADELSESFIQTIGKSGRHFISEVTDNVQGWMPEDTWYFFFTKSLKKDR
jgi:hypothetical protein